MARYQITAPDGSQHEITAPDGATEQDVMSYAQAQFKQPKKAAPTAEMDAYFADKKKREDGPVMTRVAQFASGANRLVPGLAGLPVDTIANVRDLGKAGAGYVAIIAGRPDLAPDITPRVQDVGSSEWIMAQLQKRGMDAPFVAPGEDDSTSRLAQAWGSGVAGALVTRRPMGAPFSSQAAVAGSVAPQMVREMGGNEAAAQIAGLLAPGGLSAARSATGGAGRYVAERLSPQAAAEKRATEAAGPKNERDRVVSALLQAKEKLPGSPVTAAGAIADANIAAPDRFGSNVVRLEQELARHPASTMAANSIKKARMTAQDEALLREGGTDVDLNADIAARSQKTGPMYDATRDPKTRVDTKPVSDMLDSLLAKNAANPDVRRELVSIKKDLGYVKGTAQGLSAALDGMKTRLSNQDNANIKGMLNDIKTEMVKAIPGRTNADATFAKMSEPVNQKSVIQALRGKLTGIKDEDTSAKFSAAIDDSAKLIKDKTGMSRFKRLEDVLTPEQQKVVDAISSDKARQYEVSRMASEVESSGALHRGVPTLPAFFDPKITLMNKVLRGLGHDMDSKTAIKAQEIVSDPKKYAEVLTRPRSDAMRKIVEAITRSAVANAANQENQ